MLVELILSVGYESICSLDFGILLAIFGFLGLLLQPNLCFHVHMVLSPCTYVCVQIFSFCEDTTRISSEAQPTLIWPQPTPSVTILFPNKITFLVHSSVLGNRTSTYKFWGWHNSICSSIIEKGILWRKWIAEILGSWFTSRGEF